LEEFTHPSFELAISHGDLVLAMCDGRKFNEFSLDVEGTLGRPDNKDHEKRPVLLGIRDVVLKLLLQDQVYVIATCLDDVVDRG